MKRAKGAAIADIDRYKRESLGYGDPEGPVWFIGIEEGGDEKQLGIRAAAWAALGFKPLEDLDRSCRQWGECRWTGDGAQIQPTYGKLCRLMLAFRRREINLPAVKDYQSRELGRERGETILIELRPGPSRKHTGMEHPTDVMNARVGAIRDLIEKFEPTVIVCYGKGCWPQFEAIFEFNDPGLDWADRMLPGPSNPSDFKSAIHRTTVVILARHPVRTSNCYFEELGRWAANQTASQVS